ncbi:MAG TPA: pantoate--beta-alanine ligase [Flavobacterium sp.]|jgi:pantoate--beta-alanine ligase
MLIFNKQADLSLHLESLPLPKTIGFVPTMGALHEGHLSLLKTSIQNNTVTVISIFVNPTQFNNSDDLEKYPRTLENDIDKISSVSNDIIVYAPETEDLYRGKTESEHFDFDGLENKMEGRFRAGHFDGVGTIVRMLFTIVKPANAYFGEKDFQQLQIIRKLASKYKLPVNIVACPIYREINGLAMSSRNERLSAQERSDASVIYKTLQHVRERFGIIDVSTIAADVQALLHQKPDFKLEYFEIADEETLEPVTELTPGGKYRAFIAVFVNKIRLIDTISLN